MLGLRTSPMRSPVLAALILAAALMARLVVPAGFMPVVGPSGVTMAFCAGDGSVPMAAHGAMHHAPRDGDMKGRCAFSDLSLPAIGGADALQLAEALLFILALGLFGVSEVVAGRAPRWRPPLRAPPATA